MIPHGQTVDEPIRLVAQFEKKTGFPTVNAENRHADENGQSA